MSDSKKFSEAIQQMADDMIEVAPPPSDVDAVRDFVCEKCGDKLKASIFDAAGADWAITQSATGIISALCPICGVDRRAQTARDIEEWHAAGGRRGNN